jgi:hypothetical protein
VGKVLPFPSHRIVTPPKPHDEAPAPPLIEIRVNAPPPDQSSPIALYLGLVAMSWAATLALSRAAFHIIASMGQVIR